MFLKDLIAHWKENRKLKEYEELDKLVGSLVENYKQKLVLLNDFQTGRKDERVFKAEFLELLNVETSLEALGESVSNDENLKIEMQNLKQIIRKQNESVTQKIIDLPTIISKIREERQILLVEQKDIKELEERRVSEISKDEKIKDQIYDDLEKVSDEDFFKNCEWKTPHDAKGKQHSNVDVITKKTIKNCKEYKVKYVFKPKQYQDDDRLVGHDKIGYETISQISQTMADVAASIVDEEFGFGLFEKTTIRKHPIEGIGSLRRYTDPFMSMNEVYEQENQDEIMSNVEEGINDRKAFRYIVNEIDTNDQNWGVQIGIDDKIKMKIIDISQSFGIEHNYNKLNSIKKTPKLREKVMNVNEKVLQKKLEKVTEKFTDFSEQIEGCIKRIRELKVYLSKGD